MVRITLILMDCSSRYHWAWESYSHITFHLYTTHKHPQFQNNHTYLSVSSLKSSIACPFIIRVELNPHGVSRRCNWIWYSTATVLTDDWWKLCASITYLMNQLYQKVWVNRIIITSFYIALFQSLSPMIKVLVIITTVIRKSFICRNKAILCIAYQHLNCSIPLKSVPNIAFVNEASKVGKVIWAGSQHVGHRGD